MIREARRTQNSKQDKIQVVKSQPSVNSLREGQEVIYIAKSNRLERYRIPEKLIKELFNKII